MEPGCIPAVVTELESHRNLGVGKLSELVATILEQNGPLAHGSELVWAIWAAIWFEIPIDAATAAKLDGNHDPFVAVLTLYAQSKGLIDSTVVFTEWQKMLTQESLHDTMWILAYEADVQGWLASNTIPNHVDSDVLFGPMKAARVSFLDQNVLAPTRTLLNAISWAFGYGA